jgi:hypothetical protein
MGNKDSIRGPSTRDRAKQTIVQGACFLGIGLMLTLGSVLILGIIWWITVVIGIVGLFWLLYGIVVYLTGVE